MGLFETTEIDEEANPTTAAVTESSVKTIANQPVSPMVGISALLSMVLLLAALYFGVSEQRAVKDIDTAGTLTTLSDLYYQTSSEPTPLHNLPDLPEMISLRSGLAREYPGLTARSNSTWSAFVNAIELHGAIDSRLADAQFNAARDLEDAIKRESMNKFLTSLCVFACGALGIGVIFLRVLKTERDNLQGSISLRHDRKFSTSVLDTLHEGILACDADGRLTLINHAIRTFHGLDDRHIPAEKWQGHFVLYSADGSHELENEEHPLVQALYGDNIDNLEVLVVNGQGPSRYCLVNGRPIVDDDNNKVGAVIVMHDISARRRAEQEAMRLASIVENSTDAIIGFNVDGFIVSWNAAAKDLYGRTAEDVLGSHASILANSGEASPVPNVIKSLLRNNVVQPMETVLNGKDGSQIDLSVRYSPIKDESGQIVGISMTARDITVRKRQEEALKDSQKRLADAQRVARMGSWEFDPETRDIIWSEQMYRLYDFDPKRGTPSVNDVLKRYHPEDLQTSQVAQLQAIKTGNKYEVDVRLVLTDGSTRYCHIVGEPVCDKNGKTIRLIGTAMDISERKKAEQAAKDANAALEFQKKALEEANLRLESLATSDGLTGLRNRRALDAQLEQEYARSSRYKANLSLLLIDIDKFKTYNDSFGHQAGDEVLRTVAKILTHGTRESDIVARYGGEELCIVLPETPFVEAGRIAERLRLAVAKDKWDRREVTVSIGVSTLVPGMKSPADLLLAADQALYVSKAEGRNRITMAPVPDDILKAA